MSYKDFIRFREEKSKPEGGYSAEENPKRRHSDKEDGPKRRASDSEGGPPKEEKPPKEKDEKPQSGHWLFRDFAGKK